MVIQIWEDENLDFIQPRFTTWLQLTQGNFHLHNCGVFLACDQCDFVGVDLKSFMKQNPDAFPWILGAFILNGISSISLPYLWYLFWKSRNHFLIAARFPKLTLSMSIIIFLCGVATMMNLYILNIYNFDKEKTISRSPSYPISLMTALTFGCSFCSFIIYRLFLVFDKWSNQQRTLQNQSTIVIGGMNSDDDALVLTMEAIGNSHLSQNQRPHRNLKRIVIWTLVISFIFFLITALGRIHLYENTAAVILKELLPVPFVVIIMLGAYILIKAKKWKNQCYVRGKHIWLYGCSCLLLSRIIFHGDYMWATSVQSYSVCYVCICVYVYVYVYVDSELRYKRIAFHGRIVIANGI